VALWELYLLPQGLEQEPQPRWNPLFSLRSQWL
jgi:hypothetical protein